MHIDRDGPVPIYQQIADIIRGRILAGTYRPGTTVPSLTRIKEEIGVTVKTAQKGIGILAAEGYVQIVDGKGTFVLPPDRWPDA